jgi:hypothetical protein
VITERVNDEDMTPNRFEWRPEDVVILEPGDPGCDDGDGDDERRVLAKRCFLWSGHDLARPRTTLTNFVYGSFYSWT